MKKFKGSDVRGSEGVASFFVGLCLLVFFVFFLYSGGEFFAFLGVLLVLFVAYRVVRYSFVEVYFEKLFFLVFGLYFTFVSVFGFTLAFFGFNLSVRNFFVLAFLSAAAVWYLTKDRKPCRVKIEWRRLLLIGCPFFIAFFVYLWPSLPSFTSPCTFGFDCTLHMEYMDNIYTLEAAAPPIKDWRYYPNGFHINGAFLAHAIEPNMPSYSNLAYPLTAFTAALIVGMLCGILYDRIKNKFYVLLFLVAILTTVYPVSALVGFGFWANLFGMYYTVLFAWILLDFVHNPKDNRIMSILLLTAIGSIIAYQILTSLIIIISFILASLSLIKLPSGDKIKLTLTFLIILGIFYGIYTIEGYSRYLGYSSEPVSTSAYFGDKISKGGLEVKLNGTKFCIQAFGLHLDDTFTPPGVKPSKLLSKGISLKNLNDFLEIGRENIRGPSGNAIYFDLKWFGVLTIFLMVVGLIYSYGKRDYTLVFLEASIIHLFLFSVGMQFGIVNLYYYSKMMYFFIYPVTLYAVVGVEELISRIDALPKKVMVFILVMLLMVSYSMNLIKMDNVGIVVGERRDLYGYDEFWPLLEYNRFLRYWDMAYGIKRDAYGFGGWLKMLDGSTPSSSSSKSVEESANTTSGVWVAATDFQHELGHKAADGSWESDIGGFGYLIGRNYMEIPKGSYNVSFRIKVDSNAIQDARKVVTIEVAHDHGVPVIAKDLYIGDFKESDKYQDFVLAINPEETLHSAEFRVHFDKSPATVNIDKVILTPT